MGDVEEYKVRRLSEVKATSVNLELRHLKAAFGTAVRWGFISKNPFQGVKQLKIKSSNLPKFLTAEEIKVLLKSIPEGNFKNLIYFYLYTGCRKCEALNLAWDEIDMEKGRIVFIETKSGLSRFVPLSSKLSEVLSSMEPNGKKPFPFESSFVTHKFKKYLRASGVKNSEGLNLPSLRHTFASHLVMAGVNLCTVSKLLGHSSVKVTEMYAHLVPDHLKASVERLQY